VEAVEALGRLGAELGRLSNAQRTPLATAELFGQAAAAAALRRLEAERPAPSAEGAGPGGGGVGGVG
jgi:hypothetical protein